MRGLSRGSLAAERPAGLARRRIAPTVAIAAVAALIAVASPSMVPSAASASRMDDIRNREYWLDDYGIRAAWDTTRGAGVTIAVIDSGVDSTHPDLIGAVIGGSDFSGLGSADGQEPVGSEGSEHGTMVASLVAGRGHGVGSGIVGAAPAASILAVSIGFGEGRTDSDDQIAEAVRWSVDHGADVINMSLTRNTPDWPESWDDAFLYAAEHDVVVVAAAGNRGSGTDVVGAPATMPGVLAVAGVDRSEKASVDASSQGITIGVAAPSEQLVGALPGDGYALWSGTSGAAPIVAGVVALVRAAHPELDAANVINRIVATARDAGAPGNDVIYGFGLIDASAAVAADVPLVDENPMGDLADWVRLYRRATSTSTPSAAPGEEQNEQPTPPPLADGGAEAPWNPVGTLVPSITQLTLVGLPVVGVLGILAVWGTLLIAGIRTFGTARRKG